MKAFIYRAALLCEPCGEATRRYLTKELRAPADPNDESSYDSDWFPKGPYPNGGGEADTPQHCDHCSTFLENPLTPDGDAYVREQAAEFDGPDRSWDEIATAAEKGGKPVLGLWIRYYFAEGQ